MRAAGVRYTNLGELFVNVTTHELFRMAYSAARLAIRDDREGCDPLRAAERIIEMYGSAGREERNRAVYRAVVAIILS